MISDNALESRLRRMARRQGMRIEKSRCRSVHMNNLGGYQLIDTARNFVIAGANYDLSLPDLAEWVGDKKAA
jgi:hypothetical protein